MGDNGSNDVKPPEAATAGKSEKRKELKASSIQNAFSIPKGNNAIDQLVIPGEDPLGIAMRTVIDDKITDGTILAVALAAEWADLEEFEYASGKKAFLFNLASRTSVRGLSREQLVKSIIGDREYHVKSRNFFDKVKDAAFGKEKEGE